jgi:hypothetical protein
MCYWILPITDTPIAHTTIQAISKIELESEEVCHALNAYGQEISNQIWSLF